MNTAKIRALTISDAEAFRELRLLALKQDAPAFGASFETESKQPLSFFQDRCSATENKVVFGAFHDEQLIAITSVIRETAPKCRHYASIFSVYTHPSYRSQGHSRRLLTTCIDQAKRWSGVDYLQLGVATTNQAALSLYQQAGFCIWGTLPAALRVEGQDIDEHGMVLKLR